MGRGRGSARRRAAFVALLVAVVIARPAPGQVGEYELKAEFIERFTRFVEWPQERGEDPDEAFVIGLVGRDPFAGSLERVARRESPQRRFEVRRVRDPDEIRSCRVLFIAGSEDERLEQILELTRDRPILTVGDSEGFAERGVVVNFFVEESTVGFEINAAAARASGLQLSSKLMKLARVIEEDR